MVFTIANSIEFTFRKYNNIKIAIWHISTHFVVDGHIYRGFQIGISLLYIMLERETPFWSGTLDMYMIIT